MANTPHESKTPNTDVRDLLVSTRTVGDVDSSATTAEDTSSGERIGRYVTLRVIGRGGMGVVYAAYDPDLDRIIAIKQLQVRSAERLRGEAKALARLSHPNVVTLFELVHHEHVDYVVMEYVQGDTVRAWTEELRPWREVVALFIGVGEGLAAAHAAGVVHGDVKPGNIIIGDDGRPRLTDFGVARLVSAPVIPDIVDDQAAWIALSTVETATGPVVGTPAYMAPEQHRGKPAHKKSDQFSFCATLYETLCGARPFAGKTITALSRSIRAGEMRPLRRGSGVPRWLRRILERGMSVLAEDRFDDMNALLDALRRGLTRRTRLLGVGFAAAILGAGAMLTLGGGSEREACPAADDQLHDVWDGQVARRARAAFVATNRPYAAEAFRQAAGLMDDYAATWLAGHRDACRARYIRVEQSDTTFDRRMRCLARRKQRLGALAAVLVAPPDATTVDNAAAAVLHLPRVSDCADVAALDRAAGFAVGDLTAVGAARTRLDTAHALAAAGAHRKALPIASDVAAVAAKLKYPPLVAEAELLLGSLATQQYRGADAETHYRAGLAAAARSHLDELEARAWIELIWTVGYWRGEHQRGLGLRDAATTAVARAGNRPELRARLDRHLARVHEIKGDAEVALRLAERAVATATKLYGDGDVRLGDYLDALAYVALHSGKLQAALAHAERAVASARRAFPAGHPRIATAINTRAMILVELGKYGRARADYEATLKATTAVLGADHVSRATTLYDLGEALRRSGDCRAAIRRYRAATGVYVRALGNSHRFIAYPLTALAECNVRLHRFAQAARDAKRALALRANWTGDRSLLGRTKFALARARAGMGANTEAHALAVAARADYAAAGRRSAQALATIDAWLAVDRTRADRDSAGQ